MSDADAPADGALSEADACDIEITDSRRTEVGGVAIRRALPQRSRRTVGAWCFVDHMGPATVGPDRALDIGPHPHIGLQTVTWLLAGEILHRDSLGSEQFIRPGQLNLMTAGHGVSHAEEATDYRGQLHGVQLWVAQPSATRERSAAFEHHGSLPHVDLDGGVATVLVGDFAGSRSPARRDTDHVGVDLDLHGGDCVMSLDPSFEYALVVLDGAATVGDKVVEPGSSRVSRGWGATNVPADLRNFAGVADRGRPVPRAGTHVVELRRPLPRRDQRRTRRVDRPQRAIRPRRVVPALSRRRSTAVEPVSRMTQIRRTCLGSAGSRCGGTIDGDGRSDHLTISRRRHRSRSWS